MRIEYFTKQGLFTSDMDPIRSNNLTILLDSTLPSQIMDSARQSVEAMDANVRELAAEGKASPYKLTGDAYVAECQRLADIAQAIIDHKHDLFPYLPYTKSGKLPQGQSILVADSDCCEVKRGNEYAVMNTLQLRLVSTSAALDQSGDIVPVKDTVALMCGTFTGKMKTSPIFDRAGVPHIAALKKDSYLKDEDVVPGGVYREGKQDVLFLGRAIADSGTDRWIYYMYIRHTNAVAKAIADAHPATLPDLYRAAQSAFAPGKFKPSIRHTTKKFTSELSRYLMSTDPADYEGDVPGPQPCPIR